MYKMSSPVGFGAQPSRWTDADDARLKQDYATAFQQQSSLLKRCESADCSKGDLAYWSGVVAKNVSFVGNALKNWDACSEGRKDPAKIPTGRESSFGCHPDMLYSFLEGFNQDAVKLGVAFDQAAQRITPSKGWDASLTAEGSSQSISNAKGASGTTVSQGFDIPAGASKSAVKQAGPSSSKAEVLAWQMFLEANGCGPGSIDGFWGPNTKAATERYASGSCGRQSPSSSGQAQAMQVIDRASPSGREQGPLGLSTTAWVAIAASAAVLGTVAIVAWKK